MLCSELKTGVQVNISIGIRVHTFTAPEIFLEPSNVKAINKQTNLNCIYKECLCTLSNFRNLLSFYICTLKFLSVGATECAQKI